MKKILLVEDDKNLAALIQKKLEKEGYGLVVASDGKDIPELARESRPDLVLLDIDLPYKNGVEVLKELREDEELASIPVIIISNSGSPVDIHRVRQLGVKDYLIKVDFNPDELYRLVEQYLKR